MENKEYMLIDGNPVEINGEKNLLEVIRKAGIELPTFCYHSELSVYGACRMCMVENSHGGMEAACSTVPKAGMEIYTNTERLHKHRKMILELLLANHCRDCTTCQKNGKCRLQELASLFGLESIRFKNLKPEPELDTSSLSIIRDAHKCILCGDCVRMCNEIQNVGAIDFVNRGSKMVIGPAFNEPIANSPCVGCGQCAAVCPTGAIVIRKDTGRVWPELNDKNTKVVAQVAPAVRVAMAKEFGLPENENSMGRITAALRQHSCAQHERRVRMLLHDRGGIAVHVHHILGIGKLHAVRERIPALGLHAGKDIRAAADQNDLHAELLGRLQCAAHHGIRGVVASHCIQNDFHACSLISPWPPGAQATGWQWPDSCLLFRAPAARAGR